MPKAEEGTWLCEPGREGFALPPYARARIATYSQAGNWKLDAMYWVKVETLLGSRSWTSCTGVGVLFPKPHPGDHVAMI